MLLVLLNAEKERTKRPLCEGSSRRGPLLSHEN